MKTLAISFIALILLIGSWLIFSNYVDHSMGNMVNEIEEGIITSAMAEDWDSTKEGMNHLLAQWNKYKNSYAFFLNTEGINQTDFALNRVKYYIEAEDTANATGELGFIRQQMLSLHENEKLTLENIF